jgi:hypothetical protein
MSDHTVLAGLSATLKVLLEGAITNDEAPGLNGMQIDLRSPREMRLDNESLGLSLWLYRVDPVAQQRSMLSTRAATGEVISRAPMVEAHYLLTPIAEDPEGDLAMLGRLLETLQATPVLNGSQLQGALAGTQREVRLMVETLTLAESAHLWQALQEPYRPSVACVARVVEA